MRARATKSPAPRSRPAPRSPAQARRLAAAVRLRVAAAPLEHARPCRCRPCRRPLFQTTPEELALPDAEERNETAAR